MALYPSHSKTFFWPILTSIFMIFKITKIRWSSFWTYVPALINTNGLFLCFCPLCDVTPILMQVILNSEHLFVLPQVIYDQKSGENYSFILGLTPIQNLIPTWFVKAPVSVCLFLVLKPQWGIVWKGFEIRPICGDIRRHFYVTPIALLWWHERDIHVGGGTQNHANNKRRALNK